MNLSSLTRLEKGTRHDPQPLQMVMSMIHPAKKPQPNCFDLATFAPSLDAEAGESLSAFLERFEAEQQPIPSDIAKVIADGLFDLP